MAIPLIGFPAPSTGGGGGTGNSNVGVPLITGESTTFATTVGSWVAYGSHNTVSRETGTGKGYPGTGGASGENLTIASTQGDGLDGGMFNMPFSGAKLTVAPSGGFKQGKLYVFTAMAAIEVDPLASGINSFFYAGLIPTGLVGVGPYFGPYERFGASPYQWFQFRLFFRPLLDSASVDVVIGRGDSNVGAQTFHIAGGVWGPRFVEVDLASPFSVAADGMRYMTGPVTLDYDEGAGPSQIRIGPRSVEMIGYEGGSEDGGALYVSPGNAELYGPHGSPGDLIGSGLNIEVGEDYVGLYISEKDPATIQIYDDSGGSYDIEFVEQDPAFHFRFIHPSGGVAIPALGMLPHYASAPHSGVEQEGEGYWDDTLHKARFFDGTTWQDAW